MTNKKNKLDLENVPPPISGGYKGTYYYFSLALIFFLFLFYLFHFYPLFFLVWFACPIDQFAPGSGPSFFFAFHLSNSFNLIFSLPFHKFL
jgi:hypothetical protein